MNRRRILIIVILICFAAGGIAGGLGLFGGKKPVNPGNDSSIVDDSSVTQDGSKTDDNPAVIDESIGEDQPAIIDGKPDKPVTRKSKYSDEVFDITLKYCNDYDVDTDHFKLNKALIVQDLMNDYMFINFTVKGKTRWECYNYDSAAFRDESQKKLKKEYEEYLAVKKVDDDDQNIYYNLSKAEVAYINDMY
ncbi:MAG: hypothetical protein J6P61_04420 [Erysipelotrichaceae bacterium]|nr:hypothetical protein [Erysipelotrichaceae bacterium]